MPTSRTFRIFQLSVFQWKIEKNMHLNADENVYSHTIYNYISIYVIYNVYIVYIIYIYIYFSQETNISHTFFCENYLKYLTHKDALNKCYIVLINPSQIAGNIYLFIPNFCSESVFRTCFTFILFPINVCDQEIL